MSGVAWFIVVTRPLMSSNKVINRSRDWFWDLFIEKNYFLQHRTIFLFYIRNCPRERENDETNVESKRRKSSFFFFSLFMQFLNPCDYFFPLNVLVSVEFSEKYFVFSHQNCSQSSLKKRFSIFFLFSSLNAFASWWPLKWLFLRQKTYSFFFSSWINCI